MMINSKALEELLNEGWPVATSKLNDFFGGAPPLNDITKLKKCLLDADMREYGVPMFADRINRELGEFKGPLVVQLVRLHNVSHPKYSETTHTDGLIKFQLSDGCGNIKALLLEPIPKLNAETPPGTKLCLIGKIPFENGMLLMNGESCRVLGGVVQKMLEKWKQEKNWLRKSMRFVECNAPKWVQFSKQQIFQALPAVCPRNETFRANDFINGIGKTVVDERVDDFKVARKAQIEEAVENSVVRKFAQSQLAMKQGENIASTSCNKSSNIEQPKSKPSLDSNKSRHFDRESRKNMSQSCRPSYLPTLFDFLETKVPISKESNRLDYASASAKMEKLGKSTRNGKQQEMDRSRRNGFSGAAIKSHNQQIHISGHDSYITEITNSNKFRQCSSYSKGSNKLKYAVNIPSYADDYPSVTTVIKGVEQMNLFSTGAGTDDVGIVRNNTTAQSTFFFGDTSGGTYQSITNQQPFRYGMISAVVPAWKIGSKCLAPWSDGRFYPSTLVAMGPADMCTVEYDEYGNQSSVPLGVLLPL